MKVTLKLFDEAPMKEYDLNVGNYMNRRVALILRETNGAPAAVLTKNFPENPMDFDEVALDENNLGGIGNQLIAEGLVGPTTRFISSGFCMYPIHRLTEKAITELKKEAM